MKYTIKISWGTSNETIEEYDYDMGENKSYTRRIFLRILSELSRYPNDNKS